jgi:hypothetical protein
MQVDGVKLVAFGSETPKQSALETHTKKYRTETLLVGFLGAS